MPFPDASESEADDNEADDSSEADDSVRELAGCALLRTLLLDTAGGSDRNGMPFGDSLLTNGAMLALAHAPTCKGYTSLPRMEGPGAQEEPSGVVLMSLQLRAAADARGAEADHEAWGVLLPP